MRGAIGREAHSWRPNVRRSRGLGPEARRIPAGRAPSRSARARSTTSTCGRASCRAREAAASTGPPTTTRPARSRTCRAGSRSDVSLPVVGTGRLDSPAVAESIHRGGHRGPRRHGAGAHRRPPPSEQGPRRARTGDIRTCIACTQSCVGHIYVGMGVGCIYNPVTGREGEWAVLPPAAERRKVVIVGRRAGRTARPRASRPSAGTRSCCSSAGQRLGGQVNLVMRTPARDNLRGDHPLLRAPARPKLGVDVRLRTEAGVDDILAETPGCRRGRHGVDARSVPRSSAPTSATC